MDCPPAQRRSVDRSCRCYFNVKFTVTVRTTSCGPGVNLHWRTASMHAWSNIMFVERKTVTSLTVPSLRITASTTTLPSMRADCAMGGYRGSTFLIRPGPWPGDTRIGPMSCAGAGDGGAVDVDGTGGSGGAVIGSGSSGVGSGRGTFFVTGSGGL